MQRGIESIIIAAWIAMFALWFVTSINLKETSVSRSEGVSRISVWIVWAGWWLLFTRGAGKEPLSWRLVPESRFSAYVGLALTIAGLAFAIWARLCIGRNWSRLIQVKRDHELIRRGPYSVVRHPIYSGLMLATLGTAIDYGQLSGFIGFVLILAAWGYKARLEESVMLEQFGDEYRQYRRNVKGLIPYVW
jgi:protein-S-isoprenylcysteine O-methyltransferase Ste14